MNKIIKVKPFVNKNTKQISITIPKKKFNITKNKLPKFFKVEEEKGFYFTIDDGLGDDCISHQ